MLRFASSVLLVGAARAAAVAPDARPGDANATARLEALVGEMAAGQQRGTASAPTPQPLAEDVVFLEGAERRRMGSCDCDVYRNGATAGSAVCSKLEGGQHTCSPTMWDGTCSDMVSTLCPSTTISAGSPTLRASPGPTFFDAEEPPSEMYLNVNLQVRNADTTSASQLPAPEQFVQALSDMTRLSSGKINVVTTWGAPLGTRAATAVTQPGTAQYVPATGDASASGTTATVHAAFAVHSTHRREAVVAQLQNSAELPAIDGHAFSIVHREVFEESTHPLVCREGAETIKAEAAALLRELVSLKQTEVELMRQGVTQSVGSPVCDDALLQRIARTLNVEVPLIDAPVAPVAR